MQRKKLQAITLVGLTVVTALILLTLVASVSVQRGEPLVYVTFLGHTNQPDGIGLNAFSISNGSPFRVNRRAVLILVPSTEAPEDAVAGAYKVLNPHETEVFDVEDLPGEGSPWRLKVACVEIQPDAYTFIKGVTDWVRERGIPAPCLDTPHEHYFLSGWTKPYPVKEAQPNATTLKAP